MKADEFGAKRIKADKTNTHILSVTQPLAFSPLRDQPVNAQTTTQPSKTLSSHIQYRNTNIERRTLKRDNQTLIIQPQTSNLKPQTPNPKPQT
jgi:hypothetical protein